MEFKIQELIDYNMLINTMKNFYIMTGISLKFFSNDENYYSYEVIKKDAPKEIINSSRFIWEDFKNGLFRVKANIRLNDNKAGYVISDYFFMSRNSYDKIKYDADKFAITKEEYDEFIKSAALVEKSKLAAALEIVKSNIETSLQLKYLKNFDTLTGFYTVDYFMNKFDSVESNDDHMGAVLIVDFFNFKYINDTYGYKTGSILVKVLSNRIDECIINRHILGRENNKVYIYIYKVNDEYEIENIIKRIYQKFQEPIKIDNTKLIISVCIGVHSFSGSKKHEEIIKKAEAALYMAKNKGENNYYFYREYMYESIAEKEMLSLKLKNALYDGEFEVYYQPLVDTSKNCIFGTEALLRWNSPEKGTIPPSKFIPLAEQNNFIIVLGKWVLENACRQCKEWHDMGRDDLIVSVNFSQKQLQDANFVDMVKKTLKETKLPPQYLYAEVTESIIMKNAYVCLKKLKELNKMGIKIVLDDFGTGYSSLNYLKLIPFDVIKIDKSFIDNIPSDRYEMSMFEGMLQLIKRIEKDVIVEGVEKKEQLDFLHKNKCYKIQGFLFGRPQRQDKIEQILKEHL